LDSSLKENDSYAIGVSGLKLGKHAFDWTVDTSLLNAYGVEHLRDVALTCHLQLEKKERLMQLEFDIAGEVVTDCDRCGLPVHVPLDLQNHLVVRFAEENDFNDDEVVFLAESEAQLEVGQFIYEFIMTGLPTRFVHPEGECDPEVESFLTEAPSNEGEKEDRNEENIDPRWEALKKLRTKD
jgi:uncharacterized metal-binding protein YceD (DUF177 family)